MQIRKVILTGGGRATRLQPITATINKHLLPLANKPMIFHAIEKVVAAGFTDIFINVNPGETQLQETIGDGGHWGVKITFFEQTGGPQGIAHAVNEARKFIGDDPFMFYLSDNILLGQVTEMVQEFSQGTYDCMLALCEVTDPQRFGVPYFNEKNELIDVVEKPQNPPNNFAVTGLYLYGPKVFFEAFEHIEKSPRGEYEISSIHSYFLKNSFRVGYKEITGWWKDTGKPNDLLVANALLMDHMNDTEFNQIGKVKIGTGTKIDSSVKIIGPSIIGENCVLKNCVIGPHVSLGSGSSIDGAVIKESIIRENSSIIGSISLQDSLIGRGVDIRLPTSPSSFVSEKLILGDKTIIERE